MEKGVILIVYFSFYTDASKMSNFGPESENTSSYG